MCSWFSVTCALVGWSAVILLILMIMSRPYISAQQGAQSCCVSHTGINHVSFILCVPFEHKHNLFVHNVFLVCIVFTFLLEVFYSIISDTEICQSSTDMWSYVQMQRLHDPYKTDKEYYIKCHEPYRQVIHIIYGRAIQW